jgi:hypothetical protein
MGVGVRGKACDGRTDHCCISHVDSAYADHGVSLQSDCAERACGCPEYPLPTSPYVRMPAMKI